MRSLRFILNHLDHFRPQFILFFVLQTINGVMTFMIPVLLAEFTKSGLTIQHATQLLLWIVSLYVAGLFVQWIMRYYGEAAAFQFGNHIRLKYFKRLASVPLQQLQKYHSGHVLSLVNKVGDELDIIMYEAPWLFAGGLSTLTLFFYFTARESFLLAVINLIILIAFVVISTILARAMIPLADEQNRRKAVLMGSFADFMANIATIKKLGIFNFANKRLHRETNHVTSQLYRVQKFHANRWFLLHGLYGLTYLATIGFLLWGIAAWGMSPALLVLFVAAYVMIRGHIERLSENFKSFMELGAYIGALDEITADIPTQPTRVKSDWQHITLKDISFQYGGHKPAIVIDDFVLTKSNKVCIIGKSGQGKSTFLGLLTGQLEPLNGRRLIDDAHYASVGSQFFSRKAAIVSQEAELFDMSLRDNLTLDVTISDSTLRQYLHQLDLGVWLNGLPHGLDTRVGEKGLRLSAGQKQRLNILRSVLLKRDLYILDEPTSHLDDATEQTVIAFLKKHLHQKTVVVVTHRPGLRQLCDTHYEMREHTLKRI